MFVNDSVALCIFIKLANHNTLEERKTLARKFEEKGVDDKLVKKIVDNSYNMDEVKEIANKIPELKNDIYKFEKIVSLAKTTFVRASSFTPQMDKIVDSKDCLSIVDGFGVRIDDTKTRTFTVEPVVRQDSEENENGRRISLTSGTPQNK